MQVAKWGNSLAVRLPASVVEALDLKEGDDIDINVVDPKTFYVERERGREWAVSVLESLKKPLPEGWHFNREEANER